MPAPLIKTRYPGIYRRHGRNCDGNGKCSCPYQATVYSKRDGKLIRRQFDDLAQARTWREDAAGLVRAGKLRPPSKRTLDDASRDLVAGMEDGSIYDRSGKPYKPSTRRGYERVMRLHVLPRLGHVRLSALERRQVQRLVEELHAEGRAASTIQNVLNPLQVICRRAVRDGELAVDPTDGLELPAVRGRRDRIEAPERAAKLLQALPVEERALWATMLYAGLRRGEARALRWQAVDFDRRVVRVERAWDDHEGEIEVKSDAGRRVVPMAGTLRSELAAHKLRTGRDRDDLVFGRTAGDPFVPSTTRRRAREAWNAVGLEPLTHEARHCAASYLIAAGLNAKQLSVYIGHSDIRTTYNRYGHLMPGGEKEAASRLDSFLSTATA
jgi:integrase